MKGKRTGKDNPFYGKHHTDKTKERMSKALSGEKNPNYGRHFSEEHKNKLSTANKGKRWFNNGKINTMAKECPPGFVPGRIK